MFDLALLDKNPDGALTTLRKNASSMGAQFSFDPLLRLDKGTGVWTYGLDKDVLEAMEEIAIHPGTIAKGWICWENSNVQDEKMVPVLQGMPLPHDQLPPYTGANPERQENGWKSNVAFTGVIMASGLQIRLSMSSQGAHQATSELINLLAGQFELDDDKPVKDRAIVPIVTLTSTSYTHKNPAYGVIHKPVIKVQRWISLNDMERGDVKIASQPQAQAPTPAPASVDALI